MLKTLFKIRELLTLAVIGIICAVVSACLQVDPMEANNLEEAFILARDGCSLNTSIEEYGVFCIFAVFLHFIFFIPFIIQYIMGDYETAKSFVFVRSDKVSKWYGYKIVQSVGYCLWSSVIYNLSLLAVSAIMGFKADSSKTVIVYLISGILVGFLMLFLFIAFANILSFKISSTSSMALILTIIIASVASLYLITSKQMQFHYLNNYFISWHMVKNINYLYYSLPTMAYYGIIIAVVAVVLLVGNRVLKKIDFI